MLGIKTSAVESRSKYGSAMLCYAAPATRGIVDTIQDLTVRWQHVLGMTGVFDLEKMALSEKRNWLQTGLELPLRNS